MVFAGRVRVAAGGAVLAAGKGSSEGGTCAVLVGTTTLGTAGRGGALAAGS
jgi:hypothetical protein